MCLGSCHCERHGPHMLHIWACTHVHVRCLQVRVEVGHFSLPPLRCALLHLLLDTASNALPPPPPRGVEKLLAMVGAAALVGAIRPQMREQLAAADWRQLWPYLRSAL